MYLWNKQALLDLRMQTKETETRTNETAERALGTGQQLYDYLIYIWMERPCAYHNNIFKRPSSYQRWKNLCVLERICVREQNRWHDVACHGMQHTTVHILPIQTQLIYFIRTPTTQQMEPISILQSHPSLLKLSQIYLGVLSFWASGDKLWWAEGVKVKGSSFN